MAWSCFYWLRLHSESGSPCVFPLTSRKQAQAKLGQTSMYKKKKKKKMACLHCSFFRMTDLLNHPWLSQQDFNHRHTQKRPFTVGTLKKVVPASGKNILLTCNESHTLKAWLLSGRAQHGFLLYRYACVQMQKRKIAFPIHKSKAFKKHRSHHKKSTYSFGSEVIF